ncbi:hypothetical protein [Maridesulfovibrio salexigens]|uniref:Lipoprotein n=1 Tax=Maridesulfovibrio salexigens (strain ATCC 14822 / DSM 2638 / NCIMB 8403 / VKM B-1763) TaxID=526222 RepID=C6BYS2_MARSD|nr:hypothetical protein [Maridesulfovibrio salexigens]ACS80679.1 hypothetical protein Desal_2625 [Maridesulfovibrio salexigens DSM 2638]
MKKTIITLIITLVLLAPSAGFCGTPDISAQFDKLSGVEASFRTLGMKIDKITGADTKPDRVYALQDMSDMCKTSKMQVHSLTSLFSVVNLVKREKNFQNREAELLKKKCGYAYNDFSRRKAFIRDILAKAKDQKLKDLAHIFDAQLEIVLEQLTAINNKFK